MNRLLPGLFGALSFVVGAALVFISAPKYGTILTLCIVFELLAVALLLLFIRRISWPWKIIPFIGISAAGIVLLEAVLRLVFHLRIGDLFS